MGTPTAVAGKGSPGTSWRHCLCLGEDKWPGTFLRVFHFPIISSSLSGLICISKCKCLPPAPGHQYLCTICSLSKEQVSLSQKGNDYSLFQKQLYVCFFQVVIKTSDYFHTIYLTRFNRQSFLERVKSALAAFTSYFSRETLANSFQILLFPLSFVFCAPPPGF